MVRLILILISFICIVQLSAQDQHFSQFYASPLTLSPALAGSFGGTYRVNTIYRDQWRSIIESPLSTYSVAGDVRFDIKYGNTGKADVAAVGLLFYADKVAISDFNSNHISAFAAYHKLLDKQTSQYLSLGVQYGVVQKNINYENLFFQDQFNGVSLYNGDTGEILPENNFAYGDISLGINYSIAPTKKSRYVVGAGAFHLNAPNVSFYEGIDGQPSIIKENLLFRKFTLYAIADIPLPNYISILPRLIMYKQGPHTAINVGSNVKFEFIEYQNTALHVGAWGRMVQNYDQFGFESLILFSGIELGKVLIGLSYDVNFNNIINYAGMQSAFELSLTLIGDHENDATICPSF